MIIALIYCNFHRRETWHVSVDGCKWTCIDCWLVDDQLWPGVIIDRLDHQETACQNSQPSQNERTNGLYLA